MDLEFLLDLGYAGLFIGSFIAATVVPFSSDFLIIGILLAGGDPLISWVCATAGNWLGGLTSYWIGRIGKWEWIEKWFKVKPETLEKQKVLVDRYGVWLALVCWVPFIGDVIAVALGFFKTRPVWTIVLLLVGKFARFLVWNLVYGLF